MAASQVNDNPVIKVEVTEGEEVGGTNMVDLEVVDLRCAQGEAVVQWVVKEEEEGGGVELESTEEFDPLCLPLNDHQLDGDSEIGSQNVKRKSTRRVMSPACEYERIREGNIAERMEVLQMLDIETAVVGVSGGGSRFSRKPSEKVKRDGQSSCVAKVRPSRKERGRRCSHGSSLEDDGRAVKSQRRELSVKYWEGPMDWGILRDIVDFKTSPVKEQQQQQEHEGGQLEKSRAGLGVGFRVVREGKLKEFLEKARVSNKLRAVACKVCEPCRRENCGACKYCKDMKRFGGKGVLKQKCMWRACEDPQI